MNLSAISSKPGGTKDGDDRTHGGYFTLDLVVSLALASMEEFRFEDLVQKITVLRNAVPFEMRDGPNRVLSSEVEVREALPSLIEEGLCSGWVEAVRMRYADRCRQSIPIRLRELVADEPGLKDTLDKMLAQIGLPAVPP